MNTLSSNNNTRLPVKRNLLNEFNLVAYKKRNKKLIRVEPKQEPVDDCEFLKDTRRPQLHVMPDAISE